MSFNEFFVCVFSFFDQATVGPNLDLLCVRQSDAAPFCENYAKLHVNAEHLEKGWNRGR